jgi:hypothetical protein
MVLRCAHGFHATKATTNYRGVLFYITSINLTMAV